MGCGSSKEINSHAEHGVIRRDSPPTYMEKPGHSQMQARAAYNNEKHSGGATATMSHNCRLGKDDFDGFSAQQAQHAQWSPRHAQHKHPGNVAFDAFSPEQARFAQLPPGRALTQHNPKNRPPVSVPTRAQHKGPSLLNGSPFNSDEPDSPIYGDAVFQESSPNIGNAQKKGRLGHAAPAKYPRKAAIEIENTICFKCGTYLSAESKEDWRWARETRDPDALPLCAGCRDRKKYEEKKWAKNPMGGLIDMSDMRQTNPQYSPI